MQAEETFMQQVVLHWQGSATAAAANTAAMQSDQQPPARGAPPDPLVSQVDRQGDQVGSQAVDAATPLDGDVEAQELPVAGKHQHGKSSCLLEENNEFAH